MAHPIYVADAFTSKAFGGNPAGVCLLDAPADEAWMQAVAAEMKHAETAFLVPRTDGYDLRWFTPTVEVLLCGHATLASAHILWEAVRLKPDQEARFLTKSGWLTCKKSGDGIEMDFPVEEVGSGLPFDHGDLVRALNLDEEPVFLGSNRMDILVELSSEEAVLKCAPDMEALANIESRGAIVTARSEGAYDFMSRYFAPGAGVPEDHATGSAHCCTGPYWGKKLGKTELRAHQASPRGAEVGMRLNGNRVVLIGQAVTTLRGELLA